MTFTEQLAPPVRPHRRNLRRWIIWSLVVIAGGAVALLAVGTLLASGAPDAYLKFRQAVRALTPEQMREQARTAENQLLHAREFALANWAAESGKPSTGLAEPPPPATDTIELTDTQLNALAAKWAESTTAASEHAAEIQSSLSKYLADPTVLLQKDRVVLAGALRGYSGAVASLVFAPRLDATGQLHIDLTDVRLGSLSMPEALYGPQRDKAIARLNDSMLAWQAAAALTPAGTANMPATKAWWGELLQAALQQQGVPPTLFVPLIGNPGGSLPTKVTGIDVEDGKLTLTIQPLDAAGRQAAIDRVKQPLTNPSPTPAS